MREGFFAKLFKAAHLKVGGGSVAVGAATALANFTFDVQSRPQLLDMGTVTVFMACSEADNVAGQLASAKALGNFALDEKGRTVMKDSNAMVALVRLLGNKNIETRRAAVMALNMCSRDMGAAVEICNMVRRSSVWWCVRVCARVCVRAICSARSRSCHHPPPHLPHTHPHTLTLHTLTH